jgi:uncharacterized protein (DUF4415 family)
MIKSTKLTEARMKEIQAFKEDYNDPDCPPLTKEQLLRLKPAHAEYWNVQPVKVPVSIKLDADVLNWFKSQGKGYQTRINAALRRAMTQEAKQQTRLVAQ